MQKSEKWIKLGGTILCELFVVFTIVCLWEDGWTDSMVMAVSTLALAAMPMLLERLCHCRMCLPLYIFGLLYSLGPMLGHCWKFYYTVNGWDKLLHTSGGVMFAILGAYLFDSLAKNRHLPQMRAIFALCFSIAVAVLWEFFEFGADMFFGKDMQADTVIYGLTSFLLGDSVGVTGSIGDISSVVINGMPLPMNGYIDIGLIDSMMDMLLETLGAAVTSLVMWLDKSRHPLIQKGNVGKLAAVGG